MKKLILYSIICALLFLSSLDVMACNLCTDDNYVSYHYTSDARPVEFRHRSFGLNVISCSAPIYDIYFKVGDLDYVVFLSSDTFTYNWATSYGVNPECGEGGGSNSKPLIGYFYLVCLDQPGTMFPFNFTGWETYSTSRIPKNTISDLPDTSDGTIRSIDTSGMIPLILADGTVNDPQPFDPYNNDYSDDIPAPEVYRDGDKIMFSNSSPDMLLLANIRWYSVDDITLFKESLSWKYRPDSIIHSDLEWLLTVEDLYTSVNGINLYDLGEQSFQTFLSTYPVENRTYFGGTNAIGNYLFGYNDALSSLKMILGQIDSSFNAPELFFRYYVPLADGTYKCGKWTKYSRSLPSGASDGAIDGRWNVEYQVSDAPLTSDDVIGSKPYDTSGMTTYTSKDNTVVVDFDSPNYTLSIDNLNQITSLFGQFPSFVSTVFSFLPSWILSLIGCTITLLVGLAVYHALRG